MGDGDDNEGGMSDNGEEEAHAMELGSQHEMNDENDSSWESASSSHFSSLLRAFSSLKWSRCVGRSPGRGPLDGNRGCHEVVPIRGAGGAVKTNEIRLNHLKNVNEGEFSLEPNGVGIE